jgi:hypothetical protein
MDFLIPAARINNLIYTIGENEAFFVPVGKNFFTRVRKFGTDYYIEYCDDYRKPLTNTAKVFRGENVILKECASNIIVFVLSHPENREF